jgi:hypothetical protein
MVQKSQELIDATTSVDSSPAGPSEQVVDGTTNPQQPTETSWTLPSRVFTPSITTWLFAQEQNTPGPSLVEVTEGSIFCSPGFLNARD